MLSEEKPHVAVFSWSRLNSVKLGHKFLSLLPPFSSSEDSRTEGLRWEVNQQRENLEQRPPIEGENERDRAVEREWESQMISRWTSIRHREASV